MVPAPGTKQDFQGRSSRLSDPRQALSTLRLTFGCRLTFPSPSPCPLLFENVALEGAPQVGIPMAFATRETRCTPGRPFLAHATHPEARPRKVV